MLEFGLVYGEFGRLRCRLGLAFGFEFGFKFRLRYRKWHFIRLKLVLDSY